MTQYRSYQLQVFLSQLLQAAVISLNGNMNQKQLDEMRKEHKEEVTNMTKAIENNTIALTRLIEKIDKE